jgi:hypothetical protein
VELVAVVGEPEVPDPVGVEREGHERSFREGRRDRRRRRMVEDVSP